MKLSKKIIFILIFTIPIFLLMSKSYAMEQSLDNLNFDISILKNGDVDIVEIWVVDMYDTNTLFKTFINDEKFDSITNVSVVELDSNNAVIKEFIQSNEYNYHVDKGYFQALYNPDRNFEIAWSVNASGHENRIYRINYTVKNCINVYNDTAEFYWKILGNDWSMQVDNITGTLKLPTDVTSLEDFKVWAHGPLNGSIIKLDNKTCFFSVKYMPIKTFLELRIAFPTEIVPKATRIYNKNYLSTILEQEQINADNANKQRLAAQKIDKLVKGLFYIVETIFALGILVGIKKSKESFDTITYFKPTADLDYYRDIPNEDASPLFAHLLRYSKNSFTVKSWQNCMSATMMSLAQKKWIEIIPGENKKDTKILIKTNINSSLTADEKILFDFLKKINNENEFTLKEFNKYTNSNDGAFYNMIQYMLNKTKYTLNSEYKNKDYENIKTKLSSRTLFYIILLFSTIGITSILSTYTINYYIILILILIELIGILYTWVKSRKITILTQKALDEKEEWIGLEKFMKDFSLLKEREIPELVLWEKYLVYATAFGIADKVLNQLKTKFPELNDDNYLKNHFTCMYMTSHPGIFHNSFSKSVSSAESYHQRQVAMSTMSSASGGGGGFSSGGGGRRPAAVVTGGR